MGQAWSYTRTVLIDNPNETTTDQNTSTFSSKETSNLDDNNIIENIDNDVSCLEREFETIYNNHKHFIGNSEPHPCKNSSRLIIDCMNKNPMQIGNCIYEIDEYRKCVHEACMLKFKDS